ncbi:MAG: Flp family type IVb pilin [Anaerolineae bacterium]|nr:hypothetical protein [Caldilineales bacterium]MDW8268123.1 Flp family type IVb pilin [Anaerolineae bacterium]
MNRNSFSASDGQSAIEYALILLLIAIIILAILLILGEDLRAFVFDLLRTWFPPETP